MYMFADYKSNMFTEEKNRAKKWKNKIEIKYNFTTQR